MRGIGSKNAPADLCATSTFVSAPIGAFAQLCKRFGQSALCRQQGMRACAIATTGYESRALLPKRQLTWGHHVAMHYFVMPLRSVETVKDKNLFSSLLRRTIENVLCQTVHDYHLILVCSERPELGYVPPDRITVVETNLPIPTDIGARRRDMNQKIAIGADEAFVLAGNNDFSIMKIDGDDLLAADLLEKASALTESNGFVINKGYLQRLGSRILWRHYRFHEICGSCASVTMRRGGQALMSAGEFADLYIKSIHPKIPGLLQASGRPLHFLPHWGAVYTMDHGDNSSGNRLGFKWRPWRIQLVTQAIGRQFPGSSQMFRN